MSTLLPSSLQNPLQRLSSEKPNISEAIKTLIAQELAKSKIELRSAFGAIESDGQNETLKAGGLFLRTINGMVLISPEEWTRFNPQGDDQTGIQRMDEIATYRAAFALWKRAKDTQNKPSLLLGREFLTIIWNQLETKLNEIIIPLPVKDAVVVREFINAIKNSLIIVNEQTEVVWAVNVEKVLADRHIKRVDNAKQRLKEREQEEQQEQQIITTTTTTTTVENESNVVQTNNE
jgi:hypothetical protein